MPVRDMLVEEASTMILEPISQQMTYIVLSHLGMKSQFHNNIYITNAYTKPSLTSDDQHNALIAKDRCDVKMLASMNPTELKWDSFTFINTQAYGVIGPREKYLRPVFYDPVADVQLVEHYLPCMMTLEFSLQFKNRESAFMAISTINNTSLKDSVVNFHDLVYSYPVSADMLTSLTQIYALRQPTAFAAWWEYLRWGSNKAIQLNVSRSNSQGQLIIKRQDIRALGVLEYTENTPQVQEQDHSVDRFVVNFTYTLQFGRPDVLRLTFPVVICNQMVPVWMLRYHEQSNIATLYGVFQEMSLTRYLRKTLSNIPYVVRYPQYDDFRPPPSIVSFSGFAEFFAAVVLLDPTPTTTIDLMALGDVALHPTTIALMKLQGQEIFDTTGLYNISVYCSFADNLTGRVLDMQVDPSLLSIDANLVLTITMSDPTRRYHLSLSEATNLSFLDAKWLDTLIANRTFFPITIIKNLQYLIDQRYCYIDNTNVLLQLVNQLIQTTQIDQQIASLITAGHLSPYAYCFATTAEQFIDYILNLRSPVSGRAVYDDYVALCLIQNLITQGELSTGYVRSRQGYPFLARTARGIAGGFNLPLRVLPSVIKVQSPPVGA